MTKECIVSDRNRHVDKPLDVASEELDLVDRLRCAPVAQLRWPIGGQYEQWDATQSRFYYCREEVRRGGA